MAPREDFNVFGDEINVSTHFAMKSEDDFPPLLDAPDPDGIESPTSGVRQRRGL